MLLWLDDEIGFKPSTKIARQSVVRNSATSIVQRSSFELFNKLGQIGAGYEKGLGFALPYI